MLELRTFSTAPKSFSSPYCATGRCKQRGGGRKNFDRSFFAMLHVWSYLHCQIGRATNAIHLRLCDEYFFVPIDYIPHFKKIGAFTIAKRKQKIISNEKMKMILHFFVGFPPKCWLLDSECWNHWSLHLIATHLLLCHISCRAFSCDYETVISSRHGIDIGQDHPTYKRETSYVNSAVR